MKQRELAQVRHITAYYTRHLPNPEISDILRYLPSCGLTPFPYSWAAKDNAASVDVYYDDTNGLSYVLQDNKRLYFPEDMGSDSIQNYFYLIQFVEQHTESPHCYLTSEFDVSENDIVCDCGAAEGNFSLSIVEKVRHIYIFEPDERWMQPLTATFAPWKEIVTIVPKYLSNLSDESTVTLDEYFADKTPPSFCKIDVEGFEEKVLSGAKTLLQSGELQKIVVCTYHYAGDEQKLGEFLHSYNFRTIPSQGYMLFSEYDKLRPPYFRRGLLRCTKE
jgi:hypothetical protein